jgi:uncharacterized membrane protein
MISLRLRSDEQVRIQTRTPPQHPALQKFLEERGKSFENRMADKITRFAGSMTFIYIHLVWFSSWIVLGVEDYPYGLLTMIVSLEAIFLSTFVMISQNRAEAKRQVIADQEWETVRLEQRQNEELLGFSQQILDLTKQVHAMATEVKDSRALDGDEGQEAPTSYAPPNQSAMS